MLRYLVPAVLLAATASASAADVYKWVDENGKTHYGDRPRGNDARQVAIKKAPTVDADVLLRQRRAGKLLEEIEQEREQERAERQEAERLAQQREARCIAARSNASNYSAARVFTLDAQGNRHYLDDSERAAGLKEARAEIRKWCKG
ncbi:MAG: DUF4124 domain-containing protein [Gammaproteobacteria bacterium]|nr:DUF4124 domain-containing protein [Gammaproteobacteria bacterium]